jgi:hypothetical protein
MSALAWNGMDDQELAEVIDELANEGLIGALPRPEPKREVTMSQIEQDYQPGDTGTTPGGTKWYVDEKGYRRSVLCDSLMDFHTAQTSPTVKAEHERMVAEDRERTEYAARVAAEAEKRLSTTQEDDRFERDVQAAMKARSLR